LFFLQNILPPAAPEPPVSPAGGWLFLGKAVGFCALYPDLKKKAPAQSVKTLIFEKRFDKGPQNATIKKHAILTR